MRDPVAELNRHLEGFCLSIFRFELTARAPFTAPFTAIPLRGAFGYALRNACCRHEVNACAGCAEAVECGYARLFESAPPADSPIAGRFAAAPRPYLLQPDETTAGKRIAAGQTFCLNLTLIGSAIDHLPAVTAAFAGLGCTEGIGKERARFDLARIVQYLPGEEHTVFGGGRFLPPGDPFRYDRIPEVRGIRRATVRFITPLDLRIRGTALRGAPTFVQLLEALLQRTLLLNHLYCGADWLEPDQGVIGRSSPVSILRASMGAAGLRRTSTRNEHSDRKEGVTGSVTYGGDISPYIPLLRLGELTGIGRSTTFGLGRYLLEL